MPLFVAAITWVANKLWWWLLEPLLKFFLLIGLLSLLHAGLGTVATVLLNSIGWEWPMDVLDNWTYQLSQLLFNSTTDFAYFCARVALVWGLFFALVLDKTLDTLGYLRRTMGEEASASLFAFLAFAAGKKD